MLNPVQKRLNFQLHSWPSQFIGLIARNIEPVTEDQLLFHCPQPFALQAPVLGSACGLGDTALQTQLKQGAGRLGSHTFGDCFFFAGPLTASEKFARIAESAVNN
jgi:hypothetical protein